VKYFVTIASQTYEVVIDGNDQITLDGVPVSADMQRVGQEGLYSLLIDHTSYEAVVEPISGLRGQYGVLVSGTRYPVKVQDERSRRLTGAERKVHQAAGEMVLRAPIPGLVVKVLAGPGQEVAEGEPLLILEAMKMENELRAPHDGTVHEVRAVPGAQVALGQVLLTIRARA
jgi:biotin carboxyl carrier protein